MKYKQTKGKNGLLYHFKKVKGKWVRVSRKEYDKKSKLIIKKIDKLNRYLPQSKDPFTIYGNHWCPWCNKAQSLLKSHNIRYKYHDLDTLQGKGVNLQKKLAHLSNNQQTIPIVFRTNKCIGGFDNLRTLVLR